MFLISSFKFVIFFFPLCRCFFIEISLVDKNDSSIIKLVCGRPTENVNLNNNHTVLWHGSQFGYDEQQKLAETMQTDALVPNISINSTKRHRCYLITTADAYKSVLPQKKRVSREDSQASIPTENGICPPGHRIDQDRCFPCFPGSYTSGQDSVCYLCPKDFYISQKAADSCWPCPEGKKTLAQGADSDEACVFFDELGHPVPAQSPPWLAIFILIGLIIAFVWIIIVILLIRYWRKSDEDDTDETERIERGLGPRSSKPLLTSIRRDDVDEIPSDYSDAEDHIYEEIDDFGPEELENDGYEVPIKPLDPHTYLDLKTGKEVVGPEKKPKKSLSQSRRESAEDHVYEIPVGVGAKVDIYEVPLREGEEDHIYEVPLGEGEEDPIYEVPLGEGEEDPIYDVPIETNPEDDLYEVPIPKRSDNRSHEVRNRRRLKPDDSAQRVYKVQNYYDNAAFVFDDDIVQKRLSDPKHIYDEVPLIAEENKIDMVLPKRHSIEPSSAGRVKETSSDSRMQSGRRSRLSDKAQFQKSKSMAKMPLVPEEEHMYDKSPGDSVKDEEPDYDEVPEEPDYDEVPEEH